MVSFRVGFFSFNPPDLPLSSPYLSVAMALSAPLTIPFSLGWCCCWKKLKACLLRDSFCSLSSFCRFFTLLMTILAVFSLDLSSEWVLMKPAIVSQRFTVPAGKVVTAFTKSCTSSTDQSDDDAEPHDEAEDPAAASVTDSLIFSCSSLFNSET